MFKGNMCIARDVSMNIFVQLQMMFFFKIFYFIILLFIFVLLLFYNILFFVLLDWSQVWIFLYNVKCVFLKSIFF